MFPSTRVISQFSKGKVNCLQSQCHCKGVGRSLILFLIMFVSLWPYALSAEEDKVMTYLTSKQNFQDQQTDGLIVVVNPGTGGCYWDDAVGACRFTAQTDLAKMNGIRIPASTTTGPFCKVTTGTGFTIGWEAKAQYTTSGAWARFFDATIYDDTGTRTDDHRVHIIRCRINSGSTDGASHISLVYNAMSNTKEAQVNFQSENAWYSYQVVADHTGVLKVYRNGTLLEQVQNLESVNGILSVIKQFELAIGNSPAGLTKSVNHFQFDGWIKNFQISGTDNVQRIKLKSSVANGEILANTIPLTTAGTLVPVGSVVELSEKPAVGYHLNWSSVKYKNETINGQELGVTATDPTFVMPIGDTSVTGEFVQNRYYINYDWNLSDGATIDGSATPAALPQGQKTHFGAFTAASTNKLQRASNGWLYELKGWSTTKGGSVEYEAGIAYANASGLNGTTDGETSKTLYAVWQLKTYTVSVDPTISGGTVTVKKLASDAGSNKVTGVTPDSKIIVTTTIDTANDYIELKWLKRKDGNNAPVVIAGSTSGTDIAYQVDGITETDPTRTYEITVGTEDIVISANFRGSKSVTLISEVTDGLVTVNDEEVRITANAVFIGKNANIVVTPSAHKRLTGFKWKYENESNLTTVTNLTSYYSTATGSYTVPLSGLTTHIQVEPTFGDKTELTGSSNPETLSLTINSGDQQQTWTGSAMTAGYTLKKNGSNPGENEYEVSFENNVNAGWAKGVVTMKNNELYYGHVDFPKKFHIMYDLSVASIEVNDLVYNGSSQQPTTSDVTVTLGSGDGMVTVPSSDYTISSVAGTTASKNSITVTARTGSDSYNSFGSKTSTYNIVAADLGERVESYTTSGTTIIRDVSTTATTTSSLGFSVTSVKLKDATGNLPTTMYRTAYVTADGQEYLNTIPANTFGKVYLAIMPATGETNLVGKKLTTVYISFQLQVNTIQQQWTTYYNNLYNLELPSGYSAYVINSVSTATNSIEAVSVSYIPKEVPVLLCKNSGTYSNDAVVLRLDQAPTQAVPSYNAQFMGTASALNVSTITTGSVYVLNNNRFVRSKSGTIPANRCYLLLGSSSARSFSISGDGSDDTTGIMDALRDLQEEQWYDLNGRSIDGPQGKGVYIVNGRKVIIK